MLKAGKQASISQYVTASTSPAVPLAFRGIDKSPMGDLPKKRGAFLDEYGDFIDHNHTTSNIGKKMVRVFAETRATLGGADDMIESIQKRTAELSLRAKKRRIGKNSSATRRAPSVRRRHGPTNSGGTSTS